MAKLFSVLVIIIIAGLICLSINSQPPTGTVSGVCIDSKTGQPIDEATVEIDLNQSDVSPGTSNNYDNTRIPGLFSEIPTGWTQGSQSDADLDFAGNDSSKRTHWEVETDGNGRFVVHNVLTGDYTVTANSSGHSNSGMPMAVAEADDEPITVTMVRSKSSLVFDTPGRYWATGQTPSLGLTGLLITTTIKLELDRLDIDKAIAFSPKAILQDQQRTDSSSLPHVVLRKWVDKINDADDEGSFYDQIHCEIPGQGPLPPGLYRLAAMSADDKTVSDSIIFVVTDFAVIGKTYGTKLLLYAANIRTGKSIAGLRAYCLNVTNTQSAVESKGTTSSNGTCTLSADDVTSADQNMAYVRSGSDLAGMQVNFNPNGDANDESDGGNGSNNSIASPPEGDLRAFIYTDRPVYRPGNVVKMKGVSRWYKLGDGFLLPRRVQVQLDITDAQNTEVNRQTVTTNNFGSWAASLTLGKEALTGEYTITETIGAQTATGTFSVAAYHKPEYQVFVTCDKERYIRGDVIVATVTASYYFGAPMSGATCNYNCNRTEAEPDENDDDDSDTSDSGEFVSGNQVTLNGNGQAKVTIPTSGQDETEPLMAYTFSATVQDSSNNAVTSQATVNVAQGDITIEATPSSTIANVGDHISVVADVTGIRGQPMPSINIHVAASYDDWIDGQDVLTSISSANQTTSADGTTSFVLVPSKPGLIDIDYTGVDDRGNRVSTDTQVWVPGRDSNIQAQYSDLSILLNKSKYTPGDDAKILITTQHPGPDALVTVEGTTLYKTLLVPLTHNATEVDLPVNEDYAPGVTISATCIVDKQCLSSQQNLVLDDPQRTLTISVTPAREHYHPGEFATVSIHTADSSGHPKSADVSVAIVDSAIFAIAPEPPGTIMDSFLPDQSDNVQSFDSTEVVYYGDVDKGSTDIDIRRKFPDTALWVPDVNTDKFGNAAVNLWLPDNLTTWRITCYGQTVDTMVGKGVGQMVVNKDLAVRLEVPTFLIKGDQSTMAALVDNNTDHPLSVQLHMNADGLQAAGDTEQSVEVSPESPATVSWPIIAPHSGTYQPVVTVQSGSLSDGVTERVPVYSHGAKSFTWAAGTTTGTSTCNLNFNANSLRADSNLTIRLTPTLLSALPPAAAYLSSYPYGSSDSTSSALVADATLYSAKGALNLSPAVSQLLKAETQQALLRLYKEQNDDGGWGWFSTDQSDCWMTAYATYGLTLAKADGLMVNQSIFTAAVDQTETLSRTEREKSKVYEMNLRAIALSTLVLAQNGGTSEADHEVDFLMRQWKFDHVDEDYEDIAAAALAEQTIGTAKSIAKANELMSIIWAGERDTGAMMSWTMQYHSSTALAGEFAPDDESTAWVLYAAENVTPKDPRIDKVARWLMANRNDTFWNGVDATGITVLALAQYAGKTNELRPNMMVQTSVNGKPTGSFHFKPNSVGAPDVVVTIPGSALNIGENTITLSKTGTGRLYYSLTMEQTGLIPHQSDPPSLIEAVFDRLVHPPSSLLPTTSGYRIKRIYMRMTTRRNFLWEDTVPVRDWEFNTGDSILVRLIVDSIRPGSRIVIDEPVPPGCRIAETSGEFDENWDNWWDYTDVRDSDIVFFVYNLTSGRHEIDYHLVAERAGRYDIMPTSITSMVDPSLNALGGASAVKIDGQ